MWPFKSFTSLEQSGVLQGFLDCHSHLLPGVDDGVKTKDESLEILALMERQGIKKLWLTPHIMEDYPNATTDLKNKFEDLKSIYQGSIDLQLAAEYMLDNLFEERLAMDDVLPLDEGKHYLLVETSYFNPPMDLWSTLQRIQSKGYYPLLAHPERYTYMDKKEYRELNEIKVDFQLNLPSLLGAYGKEVHEKAKWILKNGWYSLYGSDTHRSRFWKDSIKDLKVEQKVISFLQRMN